MPGDVSGEQSGAIVDLILAVLQRISIAQTVVSADLISLMVRKGAHMAEYAVLFVLYRRALLLSGAKHPGLTAFVLSAGYAAADEWHQGFVADRNPSPIDVGVDTLGAVIAWSVQDIAGMFGKKKQQESADPES